MSNSKRSLNTKLKDSWAKGFACAAAIVAKEDGFVGYGAELVRLGGFNLKDLKNAEVEQCDIDDLKRDGLK